MSRLLISIQMMKLFLKGPRRNSGFREGDEIEFIRNSGVVVCLSKKLHIPLKILEYRFLVLFSIRT